MSLNLSLSSVLEKNKLSSDVAIIALVDIEIVDPATGVVAIVQHIANNPESVVYRGTTYQPGTFDLQLKQEAGKMGEASVVVNDYTQSIQSLMQQYGGGVGSNVTIYIVMADNLNSPPEIVEYFQVVNASASGYVINFGLGAENSMMTTFPRRRQRRDFCQWRYKDPDTCKYSGGMTSCDLTLKGANGCKAHNNVINFGGMPGLNAAANRYY